MTNPPDARIPAPRPRSLRRAALCLCGAALAFAPAACSKEEAPPPPRQSAPPPPPPPRVSLDTIKLAPKVQFPEERMPTQQEIAEAVAEFAGAIASGDHQRVSKMVGVRDRAVLATLVKQGEWQRQTAGTDVVRVCIINEADAGTFQVGLGIQDKQGAFLSAWEAQSSGGAWEFRGYAVAPKFATTAKELDGVALTLLPLPEAAPKPSATIAPADQNKDKAAEEPAQEEAPEPSNGPQPMLVPKNY